MILVMCLCVVVPRYWFLHIFVSNLENPVAQLHNNTFFSIYIGTNIWSA